MEKMEFVDLENTVFTTQVSARGAHLILGSQRGAFIRAKRSFERGPY